MCFAIKIDQPYALFSRRPPLTWPIPGTNLMATLSPHELVIEGFSVSIPVGEASFSAFLDLKKGEIRVFIKEGALYFRYRIKAQGDGIHIIFDRGQKKRYFIPCVVTRPMRLEELSCGVYKKPEVERVKERGELREILPFRFMGAQWFSHNFPFSTGQSFADLRRLFVDEGITIPAKLPCGRVTNLLWDETLEVDFLWSNGRLQKVILTPLVSGERPFFFPGESCRLRYGKKDKGTLVKKGQILSFKKGIKLFLDRFM